MQMLLREVFFPKVVLFLQGCLQLNKQKNKKQQEKCWFKP